MRRLLLIDNYDSFTYNLVQALSVLDATVDVVRNDRVEVEAALERDVDGFVISPGPCTPREAGISVELCRRSKKPVLGVCLGHQSLAVAFGAKIARAERIFHGKTSRITHDGRGLFAGLPNPFPAARYHSLVPVDLPDCLEVCAETEGFGELMAVRHKELPLFGVQFHPESYLTPSGPQLLRNFLESA